jgi:hypothetical protein
VRVVLVLPGIHMTTAWRCIRAGKVVYWSAVRLGWVAMGTAAGGGSSEPPTRRRPTAVLLGNVLSCAGQPAGAAMVSTRDSCVQRVRCGPRTLHRECGVGPQLQVNWLHLLLRRPAAPAPAPAPATATTSATTASTAHDVVGTVCWAEVAAGALKRLGTLEVPAGLLHARAIGFVS